jgi:hypothetical protein
MRMSLRRSSKTDLSSSDVEFQVLNFALDTNERKVRFLGRRHVYYLLCRSRGIYTRRHHRNRVVVLHALAQLTFFPPWVSLSGGAISTRSSCSDQVGLLTSGLIFLAITPSSSISDSGCASLSHLPALLSLEVLALPLSASLSPIESARLLTLSSISDVCDCLCRTLTQPRANFSASF